jgi:hypothetical protein
MEPRHSRDVDDIVSNLNEISQQFDESLNNSTNPLSSSPTGTNDRKQPENEDQDKTAFALEEYLASRLQQIGEVPQENEQVGGLKTGNGWDANQVVENVYRIDPISVKHAAEIALASNKKFKERFRNFFRRPKEETKIAGTPTVEFIPIWKLKGFHECYYLRAGSYKVRVNDDVVGVEVEGKSRDLLLEKKQRHFIPALIAEKLQMLGTLLTSESKYFVINSVLELAAKKSTLELTITGHGRSLNRDEEEALISWRSRRVFDMSELTARSGKVHVRESILTKEGVLSKFREEVVRMPERFKQILSSRLEITELKRIYVPFIRVCVQKGLVPEEVVVNGASGELAEKNLLELLD